MDHAQIKLAMAGKVEMNAALSHEDAIAFVISLIDRLDPLSGTYARDLTRLLRLGATLLQRAKAD